MNGATDREYKHMLLGEYDWHVEDTLNKYGISIVDNELNFRPAHEVLAEVCHALKQLRKNESEKSYEINKEYLLKALAGHDYRELY